MQASSCRHCTLGVKRADPYLHGDLAGWKEDELAMRRLSPHAQEAFLGLPHAAEEEDGRSARDRILPKGKAALL